MPGFDEKDYRQHLINAGVLTADAVSVAERTAARLAGGTFDETALYERLLQTGIGKTKAKRLVALAAPTPKRAKKPGAAIVALGELTAQVEAARQEAMRKRTTQAAQEAQLSLFEIAPWADNMRAMPNDFGRMALFTVRNKRVQRAAIQNQALFHINRDAKVTYTGIELRADDDELVFQQVLEYAKRSPVAEEISFTFYELCKDLDWSINGRYYDRCEECLTRLQASAMQFSSKRVGRLESLSLLRRFRVMDRGKRTSRCVVELDPEIVLLFAGGHYTKFEWERYRKLSPTARRMFDYFASHQEPFPLKLETFRLMCGSDSERPKKWREQSGKACNELRESGLVKAAWLDDGDLIHCTR